MKTGIFGVKRPLYGNFCPCTLVLSSFFFLSFSFLLSTYYIPVIEIAYERTLNSYRFFCIHHLPHHLYLSPCLDHSSLMKDKRYSLTPLRTLRSSVDPVNISELFINGPGSISKWIISEPMRVTLFR